MAKHVGRANLGRCFQAAFARLGPGGLFQSLPAKPGPQERVNLPPTRADLYRE